MKRRCTSICTQRISRGDHIIDSMSSSLRPVEGEPRSLTGTDLERALESHRRELTGYCYRMMGAGSEAEDAVQETMVRAWASIDRFEGRSSLRTWLYTIANNICIDMLRSPQRRARPMEKGPPTATPARAPCDHMPAPTS